MTEALSDDEKYTLIEEINLMIDNNDLDGIKLL